jgi:DNA-binding NarL/FixJ family response regulator
MDRNILVIEDIQETQQWLANACQLAFPSSRVEVAPTIARMNACLDEMSPDMALVDLRLPDGEGHTCISTILARYPDCTCIVVTIYADEAHLLPSLRAGAHGYILKDQTREKIARMLTQAVAGELPLSPAIARIVRSQFLPRKIPEQGKLSQREQEILRLIAEGANVPKVALLLSISKYTVEDHVSNIYRKLGLASRAEAVLAAQKLGLLQDPG